MHRRQVLCSLLFLLSVPVQVMAGPRTWTKVPTIVLVAPENDPRLQITREAIEFWNRTLAESGTPFRLGAVVHTTAEVPAATLQWFSLRVMRRVRSFDFPARLQELPGDVLVVLSDGDFISFAARSASGGKVLVGIRSARLYPFTLPNVARNVIAHELGHAIGLGHNDDPTKLMCGRPAPCRPSAFQSKAARFFPLTDDEKARLLKMYPTNWMSHE